MDASEINRKLLIDEDPYIVITTKGKDLSSLIYKRCVKFKGEVKIVREPLIAQELLINRKKKRCSRMRRFRNRVMFR